MKIQLIDTAPKDGTIILGFDNNCWYPMVFYKGIWILECCIWEWDDKSCFPTHWLPLPPHPNNGQNYE